MMPPSDPSAIAALAWADRLYTPLIRESDESAGACVEEALEAYRAVSRRYPSEGRAHRGAARCLFRLGKYQASVNEYRASQCAPAELATAIDFALAANRIQKGLPSGHQVRYLVRRSRSGWIALTARVKAEDDYFVTFTHPELRPYRSVRQSFVPTAKPVPIPISRDDCRRLYVFAPYALSRHFFVQTGYSGGTVSPNEVYIVGMRGRRLVLKRPLRSLYGTHILTYPGGAWVAVMRTVRMQWADVYRLQGGRISFSISRPPDIYWRPDGHPVAEDRLNYGAWMRYAATLTVQRRRKAAAEAWREAERCAHGAIREESAGRYFAPEMYGDVRENLREIRRRLAWIRRNEWGHWLLYRPYGWGLQVPPYRLGKVDPPLGTRDSW